MNKMQPNIEEQQYLQLVKSVIETGILRKGRTDTDTLSKFGAQLRFDLHSHFPLLTTKRVFWRGVVEELLWFISGSTNSNVLHDKGVKIWDAHGSRQYLDSIGLNDREEGDLGKIYGFQWRHYGAEYINMHSNYTGKGIDQLQTVIDTIKNNPNDRRMLICSWNPCDLPEMALPPCHVLSQFYVANGELSCQMYQRSCDLGLGVPFNIASYSLLTCIIAHVCGLKPGEFIHSMGDVHVYVNHIDALKTQLSRTPSEFPRLHITRDVKSIDDFCFHDFKLKGYNPQDSIAMELAV